MLRTAAIIALVIFHLAIFTVAARKVPRVIEAARRSRLIACLGAAAVLSLVMVAISRFALHSRLLTLTSAVFTMISFILTFKLSAKPPAGVESAALPCGGSGRCDTADEELGDPRGRP